MRTCKFRCVASEFGAYSLYGHEGATQTIGDKDQAMDGLFSNIFHGKRGKLREKYGLGKPNLIDL